MRTLGCIVIFLLSQLMLASQLQAEYEALIRRLPEGANAVVLIDVEQLLKSPLGKKENWREKHESQFQSGLLMVPPQTEQLVMAAHLDPQFMQTTWQTTLLELKYEPNLAKAAAMHKGSLDKVGGLDTAILPGDVFVVQFAPKIVGIGSPANRQNVGRWIAQTKGKSANRLSEYLTEAVKFAERGAPIIMAVDLEDVFSESFIRSRLAASPEFAELKLDANALSKSLASIRGLSLGITVNEKRFGKLKVDFGSDIAIDDEAAKKMILHILGNHGAMIDEFSEWTAKVTPRQITLEGHLQPSGMRRLLSIFDTPPSLQVPEPTTESQTIDYKKELEAQTTKKYYRAVVSLVEDLRNKKGSGNSTTGLIAKWYGSYAKKIDNLPLLNVDPECISYGKVVADMLRTAETSMRDIGPRAQMAADNVGTTYNTYSWSRPVGVTWAGAYGSYGWANVADDNATRDNQIKASNAERMRGFADANLILQHIDQVSADVRRDMTAKHGIEF